MQKKILEFANLLRKSGIRVSVAEALDAFAALDELSLEEREIFRDALRTSMVKRSEDIPSYDQLFDLFWSGFYDNLREAFGDATKGLPGALDLEALLKAVQEGMANLDPGEFDLSELARALLTQDLSQLEKLIREAAEAAGVSRIENLLQIGFFSRRLMERLNAEGAAEELRDLAARLQAAGMSAEQAQALQELIQRLMEALRKAGAN